MRRAEFLKDDLPPDAHPLDAAAYDAIDRFSQRCSRRGLLARIGRVGLGALGASIAYEVLPVGRSVADASVVPCDSWYMCGFLGIQCACTGCSGDLNQCPNCACVGGSWTACCCTFQGCTRYRYADCYSQGDTTNGPCVEPKLSNCGGCRECRSPNQPPVNAPYPGNCGGVAMCVRVRSDGACNS